MFLITGRIPRQVPGQVVQAIRTFSNSRPSLVRRPPNLFPKHEPVARRQPPSRPQPTGSNQPQEQGTGSHQPPENSRPENPSVSDALRENASSGDTASLLAPVRIPPDPAGVLQDTHPATSILAHSAIVVQRQLEMMNVMIGFEQANRYVLMDPEGRHVGYLAEQEHGMGGILKRQMFGTRRSFTAHVFDRGGREVLRFHRPFSWINSRIRVMDPLDPNDTAQCSSSTAIQDMDLTNAAPAQISPLPNDSTRIIGEAHQQWAPLRRKYNLFLLRASNSLASPSSPSNLSGAPATTELQKPPNPDAMTFVQFAHINEPFLSWSFTLAGTTAQDQLGTISRSFAGFAREIFTDTGVYALRMDAAASGAAAEPPPSESTALTQQARPQGMSLDMRAVMLATAVSIDFDYFSRHSGAGSGGFMPFFWPMGEAGGAAGETGAAGAAGGAAAGEAGAAGAGAAAGEAGAAGGGAMETAAGTAGNVARGGAAAGAGTIAGMDAMQRGRSGERGSAEVEEGQGQQGQGQQSELDSWKQEQRQAEQQHQEQWGQDDDDESGGDWFGGFFGDGDGDGDGW
ncbi:Scramblase-domain-containing protein [Lineolata rhizophorae]|uniref:Scramblase-domain-containing protein n=1 Tax=Lineolata rhizophorae TaxID=578093 RepID=A0A6A6NUX3_9PEZI|nr:Scramblase-domain-containing protein [Lineolata rhizophorae]